MPWFIGGLFIITLAAGFALTRDGADSDNASSSEDQRGASTEIERDDGDDSNEPSEMAKASQNDTNRAAPEGDEADGADRESSSKGRGKIGGPSVPYQAEVSLQEIMAKNTTWNPPRPLRLLVKHGAERSESNARQRAEEAHRRFAAGESSFTLIRELSDPPRGIPQELITRYQNLPPDQSSPVIDIEGGFVVFFGTPTERPAAE
jgi:hypothetical protein